MGAACCVAAKDKTISSGSPITGEPLHRHVRYSPTWSFRWDNRVRVAEEETTANWLISHGSGNERLESKSGGTTIQTVFASERDSPLDSSQSCVWQKSPVSELTNVSVRISSGGRSLQDHSSPQTTEVKESMESPSASYLTSIKLSPTVPSVSSTSVSPLPSKSHFLPPNSTPSRWRHRSSPGHRLLRQASDTRTLGYKSPTFSISEEPSLPLPASWTHEPTRASNGDSSDSWSIPGFSELMNTRRERWSFDSEASGISLDKLTRSSGQNSLSPSLDMHSCGICTNLITERSSWGWSSQKIISTNELAVVSVLTCGHVYHADCLEYMTPEIDKYDPSCPVCTFGEKKMAKMSEKALKAELDSKARKKYRKRIADKDLNGGDASLDYYKNHGGVGEKGPKLRSSLSMKSSFGKPFLRRHFSFGSKSSSKPSPSENQSSSSNGIFHCYKPSCYIGERGEFNLV